MKRIAILLDDVTGLFAVQKQQRIHQDFPLILQLQNQGREYGMCIWAAAHEPRLVLSSAKNVNVRLMAPLSSGADAEEMARNLGLDHAEAMRAKNLVEGEAIIKVGSRPFGCLLVELGPSRVNRQLTVDQARRRSEELRRRLLSHVKPRSKKIEAILRAESGTTKKREDADSYLVKVAESTGLMISEIREKYKLTIQKEMSLRKQNVERGYIVVREVTISARGKNPKIPEVTRKGRERLAALGRKVSHQGKGSAEHVFW